MRTVVPALFDWLSLRRSFVYFLYFEGFPDEFDGNCDGNREDSGDCHRFLMSLMGKRPAIWPVACCV